MSSIYTVIDYPNPDYREEYASLHGLDDMKQTLEKEAEIMLQPDLLEKWSKAHHGVILSAIDLLRKRPPLFIFAGDVGTGKTALATSFGDQLATKTKSDVTLYSLNLTARGKGVVGEMTDTITKAFSDVVGAAKKANHGKNKHPHILHIDEADALAQSRESAQMHHEDRAGVNALIRGIDSMAVPGSNCLIVMCTNRLEALDPAVRRRAAATFIFKRPNSGQRIAILKKAFSGTGMTDNEIEKLSEQMGSSEDRPYDFTYSDITQKFIPTTVLSAYPDRKIGFNLALDVLSNCQATRPFQSE